ncbi:MAG: DUF255 domain-containing protein [Luteolibacter sp.]
MRIIFNGIIFIGLCLLIGCREKTSTVELPPEESSHTQFEEEKKPLEGMPGPVYEAQLDSKIDWHTWTAESFEKAERSGRLVFAVVVMPQQPAFEATLAGLEQKQEVISEINENYVPILIDGDAVREMGLLTIHLCAEIRSGLKLPLMIWMSPQGAPVAWMPLSDNNDQDAGELFRQSHVVLHRMWQEETDYILKNSAADQKMRAVRLKELFTSKGEVGDAGIISMGCLRQLISLYDPLSRTLDETGGLFPTGSLNLLAAGVQTGALPERIRKMSKEVLESLLDDLLRSAMFDPLAGGAFESRRGRDWSIPSFSQTCSGQARVAVSLFESYAATGDERALKKALELLEFSEKTYLTEDGMYAFGRNTQKGIESWLWSFSNVRDLVTPEEFPVFWIASGLQEDGNIPEENDPKMKYFRMNSLMNAKGTDEIAEALGVDEAEVVVLLESAKAKLLDVRNNRLGVVGSDSHANASATMRMVSAFATAYRITGDEKFKGRAEELLEKAKEAFGDRRRLRLYSVDAPESIVDGRAFLYALAIQASLDVYAITLDENWKYWAADLGSTASELFAVDGYIQESSSDVDLSGLPVSNNTMVFEESSAGLFAMAVQRLSFLDIPVPQALKNAVSSYPVGVSSSPILHADLGEAGLLEGYGKKYLIGENVSGELKDAILRLPLKGAPRTLSSEEPDKVRVVDADGNITEIKEIGDIQVPSLP